MREKETRACVAVCVSTAAAALGGDKSRLANTGRYELLLHSPCLPELLYLQKLSVSISFSLFLLFVFHSTLFRTRRWNFRGFARAPPVSLPGDYRPCYIVFGSGGGASPSLSFSFFGKGIEAARARGLAGMYMDEGCGVSAVCVSDTRAHFFRRESTFSLRCVLTRR